jgi:hypothetical protein
MRPLALAAALVLLLVAGEDDAIERALRGDFSTPPPSATPPSATSPSTPPPVPPPAAPRDPKACEAPYLAYLVGRPRTEIPVPVDPSRRRVACTTCPAAQDYRPDRTSILFDAATGLITAVTCG